MPEPLALETRAFIGEALFAPLSALPNASRQVGPPCPSNPRPR